MKSLNYHVNMGIYKIRIILLISLFLLSSCSTYHIKSEISDFETRMLVVLSNDLDFFGKTYLRFYNKENQIIKEEIIKKAGFYYSEIIDNEMYLLGSNELYKINLDTFEYNKLNIPDADNIIFDRMYIQNDTIAYERITPYNEKTKSINREVCLFNFKNKEEICKLVDGGIVSLFIKEDKVYSLLDVFDYSKVVIFDFELNVLDDIKYDEIYPAKIIFLDDKVGIKFNNKIYDLDKNILYFLNEDIDYIFMQAVNYKDRLKFLYTGSTSYLCDINDNCVKYDDALFSEGISNKKGLVFTVDNNHIKKTIIEDIILFDEKFEKVATIKYRVGLNVVGIYYKQ